MSTNKTTERPALMHDREGRIYWPGEAEYEAVMLMRELDESTQRKLVTATKMVLSGELTPAMVAAMTDDERRAYILGLPETYPTPAVSHLQPASGGGDA
jgi:hypothetical protein